MEFWIVWSDRSASSFGSGNYLAAGWRKWGVLDVVSWMLVSVLCFTTESNTDMFDSLVSGFRVL
jgi:hypothetical protein